MIFNMVGGGGGGLKDTDAVLIVSVPTGSTVTATKNGTTLTPTIWVQNADNTLDTAIFSVKASTFDSNPWTVTATLNGDTASDTVVIDSAKEYSIELSYTLWLYNEGNEYSSTTGGWVKYSGTISITKNQNYIYFLANGTGIGGTNNAINVSNYSTLYVDCSMPNTYNHVYGGLLASKGASQFTSYFSPTTTRTVHQVDISAITGSFYIGFSSSSAFAVSMYSARLE